MKGEQCTGCGPVIVHGFFFSSTLVVLDSGSTRSSSHSPWSAWPGTPHIIQYHPASSASNVL